VGTPSQINVLLVKDFHNFSKGSFTHIVSVIILCAVTAGVFLFFNAENISNDIPIGYEGDSLYVLANIKAAQEGDILPFLPIHVQRLNAPYGGQWSDFPMSELVMWLPSILIPVLGSFGAVNFFVMLCLMLAGLSFYFVAIKMGTNQIIACVFGILFALAPYGFVRNLEHLMLTIYFMVPIFLYGAWKLYRVNVTDITKKENRLLFILIVISSMFNPYYWAMFLILLAFVTIGHIVKFSKSGVQICLLMLVAALFGFFLQNIDTFIFQFSEGKNDAALTRNLWWMTKFGLYLPDMILPKFHLYFPWEQFAGRNYHWNIPVEIQGESQTAYLGIFAILGLAILIFRGFSGASAGLLQDQPALFWFVIIIFGFAVVGGVNYLLGALGFQYLRASNRYSLFLAAIGLLYLAMLLNHLKGRPMTLAVLSLIILGIGIFDQVPNVPDWQREKREQASLRFAMDREFFPEMESCLPEGAMVFQFPVHPFPERGSINDMGDYEHFRPYIHTQHLRFSYGTVKGRKGTEWQAELSELEPLEIVDRLHEKGFYHILINRRAYMDNGKALTNLLVAAGMSPIMQNNDFLLLGINRESL
jgi:hypothetical protein